MTIRAWASRAVSDGTASRCASSTTRSPSRARRDSSGTPVRVPDLRTEQALLDALALARGKLWPLRVGAVSDQGGERRGHRGEPGRYSRQEFRVPTPELASIRHAWDKREVYGLAERLSIPVPRTWFPRSEEDLAAIEVDDPVVLKPAIKEHFFYATHAKAWRADTAAELLAVFRRATEIMPASEVIVQEMIPGGGEQQYAYCAFFREGRRGGEHDGAAAPSASVRLRPWPARTSRRSRCRSSRNPHAVSWPPSTTTGWSSSSTSAIRATASASSSTSTPGHGVTTRWAGQPGWTFPTCCSATRSARRWKRRTPGPVSAGSGSAPTCPTRCETSGRADCAQASTCVRSAACTPRRSSRSVIPYQASYEIALLPYLAVKRGL